MSASVSIVPVAWPSPTAQPRQSALTADNIPWYELQVLVSEFQPWTSTSGRGLTMISRRAPP